MNYTESQILKTLKEVETGRLVKEVCREMGYPIPRTTTGKQKMMVWKPQTSSGSRYRKKRICA